MQALAVLVESPEHLVLSQLELVAPGADDVVVATEWSGISTGTERLLWSGRMPPFPGMGYPLVPGYEIGRAHRRRPAQPRATASASASSFPVRAASRRRAACSAALPPISSCPAHKAVAIPEALGRPGVLLALAATAQHALARACPAGSDHRPWRARPAARPHRGRAWRLRRRSGRTTRCAPPAPKATRCVAAEADSRKDYRAIYDVSGDASLLDTLIGRLAPGGEIVLAGFYDQPISFAFPPAFMREARLRIAAEWRPADLARRHGAARRRAGSRWMGSSRIARPPTTRPAPTAPPSAIPPA